MHSFNKELSTLDYYQLFFCHAIPWKEQKKRTEFNYGTSTLKYGSSNHTARLEDTQKRFLPWLLES